MADRARAGVSSSNDSSVASLDGGMNKHRCVEVSGSLQQHQSSPMILVPPGDKDQDYQLQQQHQLAAYRSPSETLISVEEKSVCRRKLSGAGSAASRGAIAAISSQQHQTHCRPFTFAGLSHEWKELELLHLDRLYGDLKVAHNAASSIQACYRNYRLRKRFSQLCESTRNSFLPSIALIDDNEDKQVISPRSTRIQLPLMASSPMKSLAHTPSRLSPFSQQLSALVDDSQLMSLQPSNSPLKQLDELEHLLQHISSTLGSTTPPPTPISPATDVTPMPIAEDTSGMFSVCASSSQQSSTSRETGFSSFAATEGDTHSDLSSLHDSCSDSSTSCSSSRVIPAISTTSAAIAAERKMSESACLPSSATNPCNSGTSRPRNVTHGVLLNRDVAGGLMAPALTAIEYERGKMIGITVFNKHPVKGLHYLLRRGIIASHSPQRISQFLLRHHKLINKITMAEFLGTLRDDYITQISRQFIRSLNIRNQEIDVAFRELTKYVHASCEEAKIMKLLRDFSDVYIEENRIRVSAQFPRSECVYLLTFALLLLHMNLHHPVIRCQRHLKMSLQGFCSWVQDEACCGAQMDPNLLCSIYQRLRSQEMLSLDDNSTQIRWLDQHLIHAPTNSKQHKSKPKAVPAVTTNDSHPVLLPRPLALEPHRRLVADIVLYEVKSLKSRPREDAHPRRLFLLNDLLLVTKAKEKRFQKGAEKEPAFHYRRHFYVDAVEAIPFHNHKINHGVQLVAVAGRAPFLAPTTPSSPSTASSHTLLLRARSSEDLSFFLHQLTIAREEFLSVEQCLQMSPSACQLGCALSKSLEEGLDLHTLQQQTQDLTPPAMPTSATSTLT